MHSAWLSFMFEVLFIDIALYLFVSYSKIFEAVIFVGQFIDII